MWMIESQFATQFSQQAKPTESGVLRAQAASPGQYTGPVRVIMNEAEFSKLQAGDVMVCPTTQPAWSVLFPSVGALVTDSGGILSHPAIIAREYRVPAVVATGNATSTLRDGQMVTVDSSGSVGIVYEGNLPFEKIEHHLDKIPETKTKIMVNIGSPDEAFEKWQLPVKGVGLGRLEFIIPSTSKFTRTL